MKPKAVEIYLVYICDDCGSRHCETVDYVKKIGKILCGCGEVLDLTPIETFKVSPVFRGIGKKQNTQEPPPKTPETKQEENMFSFLNEDKKPTSKISADESCLSEAVDLLLSLGWKKKEASEKVKRLSDMWMQKENKSISKETMTEFAQFIMFQN